MQPIGLGLFRLAYGLVIIVPITRIPSEGKTLLVELGPHVIFIIVQPVIDTTSICKVKKNR